LEDAARGKAFSIKRVSLYQDDDHLYLAYTKVQTIVEFVVFKSIFGCNIATHPRGVHCTKLVRIHVSAQEGIDLDLAVLRIHTIDIFRTEKHSRILTLDIYIKRNTSVYKGI
jgi:hypothetical protein